MNSLAIAGGLGAGILAGLLTLAISLIPNTLAMWAVMKMEMGGGELTAKATFTNCFLCVAAVGGFDGLLDGLCAGADLHAGGDGHWRVDHYGCLDRHM